MGKSAKARIAYVGSALESGEMEVRELVPALLAFSDLVEHANRALGGEQKIKVMLNQDSLKHGSFDITFLLDTTIIEQAKLFFGITSSEVTLSTLVSALGWEELNKASAVITVFGTGGAFGLIKWLRGKVIKEIKEGKEHSEITLNDGTKGFVDNNTLKIYLDIKCRMSIEKVIEPVKHDGIEAFELRNPESKNDDTPIERISKEDASLFDAPNDKLPDEELKSSPEHEAIFKIVSVNFDDGKWKFNDGESSFWASMEDEEFDSRIKKRELSFAWGDMLKVKYFTQQKIRNGNLTKETTVAKVIDIIRQPEQILLDFEKND